MTNMNIFTKIKNWIIHKPGGYTREEYRDELIKRADMVRTASELLEKYTAEHEAYLAVLNCHNATAEAAQKAQGVTEAAKAIKAHCKEQSYCEDCELADESGVCKLANSVPCCWEVE